MWLLLLSSTLFTGLRAEQPGYGYVGPACAVVDGTLFLHGVARRILDTEEDDSFQEYQKQLSLFTLGSGEQFDAPLVPSFCNGLDDSVEVVLSSCIVRNNHVYEDDRLVRPLSNREKQRLATAISRRSRSRRSMGPGHEKQRDFSTLIHKFLNVNSSVTSRFLPVVSQSPLFSMDGALESVLAGAAGKEPSPTTTSTTTQTPTTTTLPVTKATFKPLTNTTKRRYTTKTMNTTPTAAAPTTATSSKFYTFRNEGTSSEPATFKPIYTSKKTTTRVMPRTVATVDVPSRFPAAELEETVRDPILLQLIAQALERNQLLDSFLLPAEPPGGTSVPFHAQPPSDYRSPVNLKIVPPPGNVYLTSQMPGPVANVPFSPHMSFTSLGGSESFSNRRRKPASKFPGLPDDICNYGSSGESKSRV